MADNHLIVVGAGPAGMAAAATAAEHGMPVTLLDEQPEAGGQIYRSVERVAPLRGKLLGEDYVAGLALAKAIQQEAITHIKGATVWMIEPDGRVAYSVQDQGHTVRGSHILLATGALERAMPVPGWTLPGVMTAGAAQIMLKASGIAHRKAIIAGAGPLIYLIAQQMIRAGSPPLALVETQGLPNPFLALGHLGGIVSGWRYLAKGVAMLRDIKAAGVKRYVGATDLSVMGEDQATGLRFSHGGRPHELACETVLLHQGVVPNTQMTRSMDLDHDWDEAQRCFRPRTDDWGQTSRKGVYVAGDGGGIGGAKAAALQGRISALHIASEAGRLAPSERDGMAADARRKLGREVAIRPFLDALYAPGDAFLRPADATIVCRCEEVTAGDIRRYARLGCVGPNQAKAFGRPGMGPCQGRFCGLNVTEILAAEHNMHPRDVGQGRIRAPIKPVTLGELAALAPAEG